MNVSQETEQLRSLLCDVSLQALRLAGQLTSSKYEDREEWDLESVEKLLEEVFSGISRCVKTRNIGGHHLETTLTVDPALPKEVFTIDRQGWVFQQYKVSEHRTETTPTPSACILEQFLRWALAAEEDNKAQGRSTARCGAKGNLGAAIGQYDGGYLLTLTEFGESTSEVYDNFVAVSRALLEFFEGRPREND